MTLTYYNAEKKQQPFCFYILCKGNNSGRPMEKPCANCFVCTCSNQEERDLYFWLCFGLWKAKHFHPFLCGSVIPFVRIDEFRKEIARQSQLVDLQAWMTAVKKVIAIEERETITRQQLQLLQQLKTAIIRQHIRP